MSEPINQPQFQEQIEIRHNRHFAILMTLGIIACRLVAITMIESDPTVIKPDPTGAIVFFGLTLGLSYALTHFTVWAYLDRGRLLGPITGRWERTGFYYYFQIGGRMMWHQPTPLEFIRFMYGVGCMLANSIDIILASNIWKRPWDGVVDLPDAFYSLLIMIWVYDSCTLSLWGQVSIPRNTSVEMGWQIKLCVFIAQSFCSLMVFVCTILARWPKAANSAIVLYVVGCICYAIGFLIQLGVYSCRCEELARTRRQELRRRGIFIYLIEDGRDRWITPTCMNTFSFMSSTYAFTSLTYAVLHRVVGVAALHAIFFVPLAFALVVATFMPGAAHIVFGDTNE